MALAPARSYGLAGGASNDESQKGAVYEEESSSASSEYRQSDNSDEDVFSVSPPHISSLSFRRTESLSANALVHAKPFRRYLFAVQDSRAFNFGLAAVIIINAMFIGIETSGSTMSVTEFYVSVFSSVFLAIYVVEGMIKLYVWRANYFKQRWNVFDFVIVSINLLNFLIDVLIVPNVIVFNPLVVIRVSHFIQTLMVLRVLRAIRLIKSLQIIVSVVLQSIPAMGSIIFLISLVLYIFAVIGRKLYADSDPARFGNLARACNTLFQLLTLDDWFSIYTNIRGSHPSQQHILVYLILFIIIETFIFVNLFTAVIVDNFTRSRAVFLAKTQKSTDIKSGQESIGQRELRHWRRRRQRNIPKSTPPPSPKRTIEDYFPKDQYTPQERKLLERYFEQLVLLEHHMQVGNNHQHTLYALIDLLDYS